MAYEVTATRRRPQRFEDLCGQEFVAETLKNSITTKQIAHSYLFAGPRGCGKTSTARILAKALNCKNSQDPTSEPCGQCESCKAITNSSSLDVIEIDGASNTSVNDVRQIKDEVMFPPNNSRYKIYIIDEVHMLSTSAFNALLKTIEEPPAYVIFIFATTELQKVPATIKSRCQQYNFRLVSVDRLKNLLSDACTELNITADDEALYWIARESGGSVRDSYTLFDQVAAFSQGHITYDKIREKLGLIGVEGLNAIFSCASLGNAQETLSKLDSFLQSGISIEQLISNTSEYLRSLLLIKNGITKESLLGQSAERYSKEVLENWNSVQIERGLSIFLQLYRDIRYSLSPRYELELAFSRLCWLKEYVSPAEVKNAIDKAQSLLETAPVKKISQNQQDFTNTQPAERFHSNIQFGQTSQNSQNGQLSQSGQFGQTSQNSYNGQNGQFSQNAQTSQSGQFTQTSQSSYNAQSGQFSQNAQNATPVGLKLFSGLSAEPKQQEPNSQGSNENFQSSPPVQEQNFTEANSNEQRPFSNGGALPPYQSAAIDYSDESYYGDSGNPEDSNMEEDEEKVSSEEIQDSIVASYENLQNQNENNQTPEERHRSSEFFTCPDGTKVMLEKLFGTVVAGIAPSSPMLSSALMQTGPWHINGNTISTTIEAEFQNNTIKAGIPKIQQILSDCCKTEIKFNVSLIEKKQETTPAELPLQVQILCNAFKGTVFGGS